MKSENKLPINQIFFSFPRVNKLKVRELLELDNDGTLFKELLDIFKNEFEENIPLLRKYFDFRKVLEISELAHRLRSTSYNVGASRLSEILKKIEADALDFSENNHGDLTVSNSLEELKVLIESLEVEQKAAFSELQSLE